MDQNGADMMPGDYIFEGLADGDSLPCGDPLGGVPAHADPEEEEEDDGVLEDIFSDIDAREEKNRRGDVVAEEQGEADTANKEEGAANGADDLKVALDTPSDHAKVSFVTCLPAGSAAHEDEPAKKTWLTMLTLVEKPNTSVVVPVKSLDVARQIIGLPEPLSPSGNEEDFVTLVRGVERNCAPGSTERKVALAMIATIQAGSAPVPELGFEPPYKIRRHGPNRDTQTRSFNVKTLNTKHASLDRSSVGERTGRVVLLVEQKKVVAAIVRGTHLQFLDDRIPAFVPSSDAFDAFSGVYRMVDLDTDADPDVLPWITDVTDDELRRDADRAAVAFVETGKKSRRKMSSGDDQTPVKKKAKKDDAAGPLGGGSRRADAAWHPAVTEGARNRVKVLCAVVRLMDHARKTRVPAQQLPPWSSAFSIVTPAMVDEAGKDAGRLLNEVVARSAAAAVVSILPREHDDGGEGPSPRDA